jgi:cupin fold WbuC family metalloprotein
MSVTFFTGQEIIEIDQAQLEELKRAATASPLKRARLCLHHNLDDKVQEMVIAFCRGTYNRPHRHRDKTESFHLIEGHLLIIFFDNHGQVIRRIKMGPCGSGRTFLYRLSCSLWHTVVPLSEFVIIHETTNGPFLKEETEFATWGPDVSETEEVDKFLASITVEP